MDIKRKCVGDVCRFILFSTQNKKPIKKTDIVAIVKKANIKSTAEIIDAARTKLSQGFGFDLIESPSKSMYFVVVKNDPRRNTESVRNLRGRILNSNESIQAHRGLISVVLQLIILYGNKVEKDIFHHVLFDKLDTSQFGSQKTIIQELKQQKWIEEFKESGDERVYYRLGIRANIETASEWQYIAAHVLVNGVAPSADDTALQRIVQDKNRNNRNKNNRNVASQSSQRRSRGGGRQSQRRRR